MAFLDPMTIGSLLVLAAGGSNFCTMTQPTIITVTPKTQEVKFDYSKTLDALQGQATDTIDPYGFHGVSMTQGYMQGAISIKPEVKLGHQTYPSMGAACLWYESIHITLEIDPTIVIAKEVSQDACMHEAVKVHEMKHIRVDREIVNKYSKSIAAKIDDAIRQRGYVSQPVAIGNAQALAERMQTTVMQIIDLELKKMDIERTERQQAIDSLEEYERVRALCPDFISKRVNALKSR